jgi:hypothetical protein
MRQRRRFERARKEEGDKPVWFLDRKTSWEGMNKASIWPVKEQDDKKEV